MKKSTNDALSFIRKFACGQCFSHLEAFAVKGEPGLVDVVCAVCGANDNFVTKSYVQRRIQQGANELMDAKAALAPMVAWMQGPAKSEDQLLSELGF